MGPRPLATSGFDAFDAEDVILCAITSRLEAARGAWAIRLDAADVLDGRLPRPSVILVAKLFTIHGGLVAAQFGWVSRGKLTEAIDHLVRLLSAGSLRR